MSRFGKRRNKEACNVRDNAIGVYEIYCGGTVDRALGSDESGLLYIGKSKLLGKRFRHFWSCAEGNTMAGHPAGKKYKERNYANHSKYCLSKITIRWRIETTEAAAIEAEKGLINSYIKRFGEAPPLNDAIG